MFLLLRIFTPWRTSFDLWSSSAPSITDTFPSTLSCFITLCYSQLYIIFLSPISPLVVPTLSVILILVGVVTVLSESLADLWLLFCKLMVGNSWPGISTLISVLPFLMRCVGVIWIVLFCYVVIACIALFYYDCIVSVIYVLLFF